MYICTTSKNLGNGMYNCTTQKYQAMENTVTQPQPMKTI